MLTTSFLFGMFYVLSNALQAMGAATSALIINMSRQGIIYIPAFYSLSNHWYGWLTLDTTSSRCIICTACDSLI